jgi:hypothetical protein
MKVRNTVVEPKVRTFTPLGLTVTASARMEASNINDVVTIDAKAKNRIAVPP